MSLSTDILLLSTDLLLLSTDLCFSGKQVCTHALSPTSWDVVAEPQSVQHTKYLLQLFFHLPNILSVAGRASQQPAATVETFSH